MRRQRILQLAHQSRLPIKNTLNQPQPVAAGHELKLADAERIDFFADQPQFILTRRLSTRQGFGNQKVSAGLSPNIVQCDPGMNTDEAKALFFLVELKHSEITDEPYLARLKAGLLAFLVGQQATGRGTKLDCLDEALWGMPGQIQDEILVQVCDIGHSTLSRQAQDLAFAFDPCIIGSSLHINLCGSNYLVSNSALLVVPVIRFIRAPTSFRSVELERLGQSERHRMVIDID